MRCCIAWVIGMLLLSGCGSVQSRPTPASPSPRTPIVHTYAEVEGTELKTYVFSRTGSTDNTLVPAIVLLHGGGWVAGAPNWTFASAERFAELGVVAVSVEYRLSTGSVTPIDALADVCRAFRWVRAHSSMLGVDPHRVAVHGVSAGGHLAAAAATVGCGNTEGAYGNGGPDALLLWSPALDVSGSGHFRRLLRERAPVDAYSPVEQVRTRMPPVHIVHGDRDTLTPLGGALRFCDRVIENGDRCELHVYPGVGHLLTRNLANQESDFDPDPVARDDGTARQLAFLRSLWLR
jgi:acetyl esterase